MARMTITEKNPIQE